MHTRSEQINDELLVLDWQSGDERSLQMLFDRWHPRLTRYARRLTQNDDGAADIVQESWLAMVKGIGRLDDPRAFSRWAYQIVTRRTTDWIRHQQRRRKIEGPPPTEPIASPVDGNPSVDDTDEIQAALARLNEMFRTVLVLRYLEEMSVAEMAEILGLPAGTIKSRLHYAREAVRPYLTEKKS